MAKWFSDKLKALQISAGIDSFKFDAGEASWSPSDPVFNATAKQHPLAITTDYINTVSKFGPMEEVRAAFGNQEMPIFLRMIDKDSGEFYDLAQITTSGSKCETSTQTYSLQNGPGTTVYPL